MEDDHYEMEVHASIVAKVSCELVTKFEYGERCSFAKAVNDCSVSMGFIYPMEVFFCGFEPSDAYTQTLFAILLVLICWILFIILALTVYYFFVPSLKVFAKTLRMSEHLAGATLVVLGSDIADVVSTVVVILEQEKTRTVFIDLIGSCFFLFQFLSSIIIVISPFELQTFSSCRDVAFVLFATLYMDFAIRSDQCVTLMESIIMLLLYCLYIGQLIVEQIMLRKSVKRLHRRVTTRNIYNQRMNDMVKLENLRAQAELEVVTLTSPRARPTVINISFTQYAQFTEGTVKNKGLFEQLLQSLNPLDMEEFRYGSRFQKTLLIVRCPLMLVLALLIPVTNYELDRHGWSKLLNCIQIVTTPICFIAILSADSFHGIPVWCLSLLITLPLSLTFFIISRTDVPPKGHFVLAILAIAASALVLYFIAIETSDILYVIGIILDRSRDFIGVTLLAWGITIGETISNVSLARNGYPRMAFSSCFGTTMFKLLFINGVSFAFQTRRGECLQVKRGSMDDSCVCFMILGLIMTMVWMLFLNNQARRSVGVFSTALYLVFLVYLLLGELNVLHTLTANLQFLPLL